MMDKVMEETPSYQWSTRHILLVEDDESSAYLLRQVLQRTGARITHMSNGREAVDFFRSHPDIDLILMDIQLPEKDGFTATREIKAISAGVVVIAQTAFALSGDKQKFLNAGCDDYISKPIQPDELLRIIEQGIQRNV